MINIELSEDISEAYWAVTYGSYEAEFCSYCGEGIIVDLSRTNWADTAPLIWLACRIRDCLGEHGGKLIIELGELSYPEDKRAVFLRFLILENFIQIFVPVEKKPKEATTEVVLALSSEDAEGNLNTLDFVARRLEKHADVDWIQYFNRKLEPIANEIKERAGEGTFAVLSCYPAQLFSADALANADYIHRLSDQIADKVSNALSGSTSTHRRQRADILHRLRQITFELLENVGLHAFDGTPKNRLSHKFAGIYIRALRIIHPRLQDPDARPLLPELDFPHFLEIQLLDSGRGLFCRSNMQRWKSNGHLPPTLTRIIEQKGITPTEHQYSQLRFLFHLLNEGMSSVSGDDRERQGRSNITGLNHIQSLLGYGDGTGMSNSLRLISDGTILQTYLPWAKAEKGRVEPHEKLKEKLYSRSPDTAYRISTTLSPDTPVDAPTGTYMNVFINLQPETDIFKSPDWIRPRDGDSIESKAYLLRRVYSDASPPDAPDIPFFDALDSGGTLPDWTELRESPVVIVRLRRGATKQELREALLRVCNQSSSDTKDVFIIDCKPLQALDVRNLLLKGVFSAPNANKVAAQNSEFRFHVITSNWWVSSVFHDRESGKISPVHMEDDSHWQKLIPTLANAFRAIRSIEGQKFWALTMRSGQTDGKAAILPFFREFLNEEVEWLQQKDGPFIIEGYLDLIHTLSNQAQFRHLRRALRRLLWLFGETKFWGLDTLIDGVAGRHLELKSADEITQLSCDDAETHTLVGSVMVSGSTSSQAVELIKGMERNYVTAHLFRHPSAKEGDPQKSFYALPWRVPEPREVVLKAEKKHLKLQRVGGAPFITRGGAGASALVRERIKYNRSKNEYELEEIYPESPQAMYDSWLSRQILKIGHWKYNDKHDILGLALDQAVKQDFFSSGGFVLRWLNDKLTYKGSHSHHVRIVSYIVSPVTEWIVRELQRLEYLDPEECFPIKPLNKHQTSTAQLAPAALLRISAYIEGRLQSLGAISDDEKLRSPVSVFLLSDRNITGKIISEVKQHLYSLKRFQQPYSISPTGKITRATSNQVMRKVTITPVVLVDRTARPVRNDYDDSFKEKLFKTLWRWDVPTLGTHGSCRLCEAMALAEEFGRSYDKTESKNGGSSVSEWISECVKTWRARDLLSEWWTDDDEHNHEVLGEPYSGRYGLYMHPNGSKIEERILTRKSVASLVATAMEITRATIDKSYPIALSRKKKQDSYIFNPHVRATLLASYILHFSHELSVGDLREAYRDLLEIFIGMRPKGRVSSLVFLTFFTASSQIAERLIQLLPNLLEGDNERLSKLEIEHIMTIARLFKKSGRGIQTFDKTIGSSKLQEPNGLLMKLMTVKPYSLMENIKAIYSLVGYRGDEHSSILSDLHTELSEEEGGDRHTDSEKAYRLLFALEALEQSINALYSLSDRHHATEQIALIQAITSAIRKSGVNASVITPDGSKVSLAYSVSQLIEKIRRLFILDPATLCKQGTKLKSPGSMIEVDMTSPLPTFAPEHHKGEWDINPYITAQSREAERVIPNSVFLHQILKDIRNNFRHRTGFISNPSFDVDFVLTISSDSSAQTITFEFSNHCLACEKADDHGWVPIQNSLSGSYGIRELGGNISGRFCSDKHMFYTVISLPTIQSIMS
ncbi:hypothetical protein [Terasakiella pusilla]|uniref:hypothetical protein n=1 Tax=Terasakiella pusilla TaxID=64973 RepID=UPI003AA9BCAF